MIKRLDINDNLKYEFNMEDSFTTEEGKFYHFVSIRKFQKMSYKKGGKTKHQTITIRHQDWETFKKWLLEILEPVPF